MIKNTIVDLYETTKKLQNAILQDIVDVRAANHEALVERNDIKLEDMEKLTTLKSKLNEELSKSYTDGEDISIYKDAIDKLELELRELYRLNGKLGSIVLPVKEMYKEIIDEITKVNGGSLLEVMA